MAPKSKNQEVEYTVDFENGDMNVRTKVYGDGLTSVSVGQGDLFNLFSNKINPNKSPLNGDFDIAGGGIKFLGFGIGGNLQFDYSLKKLTVDFGFGVPGFHRSGTLFNGQDDFTNDWGNFGTGVAVSAVGLSLGVEVGMDYRTDEFGRTTAVAYGSVDPIFISIDVESDLTNESWVQDGKKVEREKTSSGDIVVQITDVNTGKVLGRDTFVPHPIGGHVPSTSIRDGMTYPAGMVKAGNEMNALDQIAHDSYMRGTAPTANQNLARDMRDAMGNDGDPNTYPDAIIRNVAAPTQTSASSAVNSVSTSSGGGRPDRDQQGGGGTSAGSGGSGGGGSNSGWSGGGSQTSNNSSSNSSNNFSNKGPAPTSHGSPAPGTSVKFKDGPTKTFVDTSSIGGITTASGSGSASSNGNKNHLAQVAAGNVRSGLPVLLDLEGDGVEITHLGQSTQHIIGADGFLHRTALAGAGDGVLFIDADGDGKISILAEYVFTEWDRTASDDMEAVRRVFDRDCGECNVLQMDWRD